MAKARIWMASCLLMASAISLAAQEHRAEAKFASGGRVQMDLGVGDYKIVPGGSDEIVVTWTGRTADRSHAEVKVSGGEARITTSSPHRGNNDVHFTIELPQKSDIRANISVGDVTVGAFDGDEELELTVGDLKVDAADAKGYAEVNASTKIGDVNAGPFAVEPKGFLGKSMRWTGPGKRRLRVHVGTGDLTITDASKVTM